MPPADADNKSIQHELALRSHLGFISRRLKPLNQLGRINAQTGGHLEQVVQAQVALSSLDLS
jgi:hypothetical protein